jgi:DNA-binding response OmpR family regulator
MSASSLILTIDHNQRNLELLSQFLSKEGYRTLAISTLEDFEKILGDTEKFGLALIDISGFGRGIWALCEKLTDQGVPLLVISPQQLPEIQQESLAHGAQGVMYKPLVVKQLVNVIKTMMRNVSSD